MVCGTAYGSISQYCRVLGLAIAALRLAQLLLKVHVNHNALSAQAASSDVPHECRSA
jgi:hypothetical protein